MDAATRMLANACPRLLFASCQQSLRGGEGFVVFQIPDSSSFRFAGCCSEIGQQLAKAPLGECVAQLGDDSQDSSSGIVATQVELHRRDIARVLAASSSEDTRLARPHMRKRPQVWIRPAK